MRRTWTIVGVVAAVTVVAGVMHYTGAPSLATFVVATIALAGLAWVVSFATEQVGERFGPAVTGVMQSTLGNLPEFFIVVFALSAGEVVVAQTSIIGSIFANALLVLGVVIVAGSRKSADGVMRFSPAAEGHRGAHAAGELPDRPHRHLGRDRRQGVAPRGGDLGRRRLRPACHLRARGSSTTCAPTSRSSRRTARRPSR